MDENAIAKTVVEVAIQMHRELGPGLLESVYETDMAHELQQKGFDARRQVAIPIRYGTLEFEEGFRADIIVNSKVLVELKCVERLHSAHKKQVLTYLRMSNLKLGLLLNFSEHLMRSGIVRVVKRLGRRDMTAVANRAFAKR